MRFLNEKWKLGSGFILEESMQAKLFGYLQQLTEDLLHANSSISDGELSKRQSEAIELLVYLKYEYIYGVADYYWSIADAADPTVNILDMIESDILAVIEDSLPVFVQYFTSNPVDNKKRALEVREVDGIYEKYQGKNTNSFQLLICLETILHEREILQSSYAAMYLRDESWSQAQESLLKKAARNKYNLTLDQFEIDGLMEKMMEQGLTIDQALDHFSKIHTYVATILTEKSEGKKSS